MTSIPDIFGTMAYGPAPEAVGPAQAWLEQHGRRFGLFVGGAWTPAGDETFDTLNPATGKPLARLDAGDGRRRGSGRARGSRRPTRWWDLGGHGRARYLYAIARQVQKHSRLFAVLETLDNGKPIRESRDIDIPLVARHFYYHAGWAQLMARELPGREPVGVIGQIIPWNFPLLMLAWKIAPALAMGNTVVLKPAEFTSLTALRFAELCQEIGLPARGRERRHRRWPGGRGDRRASRGGQDRVHRLDRGGTPHPRGDRRERQEALAGAGRQVAVRRLPGRRPGQRRRGRGGRDLVQSGAGLLRGLAHPGAGGRRGAPGRQAQGAHGDAPRGRSAGQGRGHGRDHRPRPAREDPEPGAPGSGRGRRAVATVVELPARGLVLPADPVHRSGAFGPPSRRSRSSGRSSCS